MVVLNHNHCHSFITVLITLEVYYEYEWVWASQRVWASHWVWARLSDHSTLFDYMNMNTWDWTTLQFATFICDLPCNLEDETVFFFSWGSSVHIAEEVHLVDVDSSQRPEHFGAPPPTHSRSRHTCSVVYHVPWNISVVVNRTIGCDRYCSVLHINFMNDLWNLIAQKDKYRCLILCFKRILTYENITCITYNTILRL